MSDYENVCQQLAGLIAHTWHVDVPSRETDLIETGILDSLKFVELLVELEQRFQTQISLDKLEIENFRSIATIAQLVVNGNAAGEMRTAPDKDAATAASRHPLPRT